MERLELNYGFDPALRQASEQMSKVVPSGRVQDNYRTQAIVYIPVVVHIVLANPFVVTDADVLSQIARLNIDFAGLNPDSTNVPAAFAAIRGHSQIQFCLARRTPGGLLTNGVERRASSAGSNITVATDPIKRTSLGGLDVWNPTQYLNLWIGTDVSGQGILGYAQFPGSGAAADDGVFLNYQSFGEATCNNIGIYNRGRTGSHEVGHYFGLYHIWGDDAGCVQSDFRTLPGANCVTNPANIPANLFGSATDQTVGDTPNQGDATTNCPTGTATDACATAAPGKMYQNFMDYTADNCYSMFTTKQVQRMEWVLDSCRASLKTSPGCQPPTGATLLDAAPLASVNPGGFEQIGCAFTNYPSTLSCAGAFAPKFRVVNNGLNTITSLTVGYRYDNGTAITQTVAVNIPSGGTYVHTFTTPVAVAIGSHTFKFFTANPNASADQVPANDTLSQIFTVAAPITAPVTEGFESTAFPPANWSVNNPNGDLTWTRTTPGRGGSLGKMSINNYDDVTKGNIDDFKSPTISVDPTKTYAITYDIAHKYYPLATNYDALTILVSGDCGQTFTQIYTAAGPALATAGSATGAYLTPAATDWVTRTITIPASALASGQIQVVFRNTNQFGNWIHIDNINIAQLASRDLKLVSIDNPGTNACSSVIKPSITVLNAGIEALTSFTIGYRIGNGTPVTQTITQNLAPGATASFTFATSTTAAVGVNTITAFTASPVSASGTGDSQTSNDTLSKSFTVINLVQLPVVEGFETAFPPAGWAIINPNTDVTWLRKTPGRNSTYSAFIDNFTANVAGRVDDIRVPLMNTAGADSVIISFDLAHKNYPNPGFYDLLQVGATIDCGTTYTAIYSKTGPTLATAGSLATDYQNPIASDWRTERIALGGATLAPGSLGLLIRNTSGFGNNIFIDNINISGLFKRDLELVSINGVNNLVCATTVTPSITVRNAGSETVTSFKVSYSINGGAAVTQTVTNVSIVRNAQINVTLAPITVAGSGGYTLKVYSLEPVTVSGTGDLNTRNDTLTKAFSVPGSVNAPLSESFVSNSFPPANWSIINPDGGTTWSRYATGNGNPGSAYVNSFNYQRTGQFDDLASPVISFGSPDSVRLTFDVAASTKAYAGTTQTPIDTLEVLVTKDCGNTFTSIYKKWGNELQTLNNPNDPQPSEFLPSSTNQWRTEMVDMTAFVSQSPLLVVFRVTNNYENNIFIDNVNFTTQTLPAQLKQQGYLVLPTAFHNTFTIWHYQTPTTVKYINIVNSAGQLVWTKQFNGNADRQIAIDLTGKAAGVYVVEVGYSDKNKNEVQRIVKY